MSTSDSKRFVRVAALQLCSGDSVEENLERAEALLRRAADAGARVAGLPENFTFMGPEEGKPGVSEPIEGPSLTRLRALARELSLAIVAGTIPEPAGEGRVRATSVLIGEDGLDRAVYRKIHLFDVDLPGEESYRESDVISRGSEIVTGDAAGLRHGLSVCYDLRFPELFRALEQAGARVAWCPAAFTLQTGKDHWEVLLRARAIENGIFVVAPAQFGTHPTGRQTYGNALIADPWGKVLARAPDTGDALAVADLDLEQAGEIRRRLPTASHHVL
ncbi:MAG: carbon-nitrogen hydrolase family protein [Deltaproteobacteria bacterium]|nr:carbon-nitrogen hydrolase family protein [Deltaproteobacteria bacterium]